MTIKEAFAEELKRGYKFGLIKSTTCRLCGTYGYCRANVCYDCRGRVETDMVHVWEIANPENKWPYRWAEVDPLPEPQTKQQKAEQQLSLFQGQSQRLQKRRRGA